MAQSGPNQVLELERPSYIDGKVVKYILVDRQTGILVLTWQWKAPPIPGSNSMPLSEVTNAICTLAHRLNRSPEAAPALDHAAKGRELAIVK